MTSLAWSLTAVLLLALVNVSSAGFNPNVTVTSCSSDKVVVRLENAADGGLIYIQERSSACQKATTSERSDYEFNFRLCSLEFDTMFRVIVQKDARYQTGSDKVIPVMCILDTADIVVTGMVYPEEVDSEVVDKTVRPVVNMRLLTPSSDVSEGAVTLNDEVKLSLILDQPFLEDFDIKATDCRASMISLITDECSDDEELFPNFEHLSRGDIAATFRAFTPTNLVGAPDVDMSFTCNVAICEGACQQSVCGEIVGWGRRKRSGQDQVVEHVTVGTTLTVVSPGVSPQAAHGEPEEKLCIGTSNVALFCVAVIVALLASLMVSCCLLRKNKKLRSELGSKPAENRKMSVAKAMGRRLSNMLNLPVGYDLGHSKMMNCIPEMEPDPPGHRRESVTATRVTFKDL